MNKSDYKSCRRYNDPGHAHALTFTCFQRKPFLSKDRTRQWFVDAVIRAKEKWAFHVWAYVIMPEHVHLLLWPTNAEYDISRILTAIKLPVTRRSLAFVRRESPVFLAQMHDCQPNGRTSYRFWQRGGGHDRNLTEPVAIWNEIAYFHANPVRRGLCSRAEEWHWSSAADYAGLRTGPIPIDRSSLPRSDRG